MDRVAIAFLFRSFASAPLLALYGLLPFILHREMGATPLQITVLIVLKPMVSLFSVYWSAFETDVKRGILRSEIFSRLPFLWLPFAQSAWEVIAIAGLYVLIQRGAAPAWMELLNRKLSEEERDQAVAKGTTLFYIGMLGCAMGYGILIDYDISYWRPAALGLAVIGLLLAPLFTLLPPVLAGKEPTYKTAKARLLKPLINSWRCLAGNRDFTHFHIGFMLGGSGLMLLQPALPAYFCDELNLSYKELAGAIAVCKGLGFALTSPTWASWLPKTNVLTFGAAVVLLFALYPVMLLAAQTGVIWIYIAYLGYGVMQAGSELVWNLSGPLFAGSSDSRPYSRTTILLQGLRGGAIPPIGAAIAGYVHPELVLAIGSCACLLGGSYLALTPQKSPEPAIND